MKENKNVVYFSKRRGSECKKEYAQFVIIP